MKMILRYFLWVVPAFVYFACQKENLILRTITEIDAPTNDDFTSIWMTDSLHGAIVGGQSWRHGCILSTSDGGFTWKIDTITDGYRFESVMFDTTGQGYTCGQFGVVMVRPTGLPWWYLFAAHFRWHRSCFFTGENGGVVVGGESYGRGEFRKFGPPVYWILDQTDTIPQELESVWGIDPQHFIAAGFGAVYHSSDSGATWRRLPVTDDFFQAVHFPTPQTGYICGRYGSLLKSEDAGLSWKRIYRHAGHDYRSVWFSDENNGWLVGQNGLFLHTDDGGYTWQNVEGIPDGAHLNDVFTLGKKGWITGDKGRIFYFEF